MGMVENAIGIVLFVTLMTGAVMSTIKGVNTSGYTATEITLWSIVGVVVIAGIITVIMRATSA